MSAQGRPHCARLAPCSVLRSGPCVPPIYCASVASYITTRCFMLTPLHGKGDTGGGFVTRFSRELPTRQGLPWPSLDGRPALFRSDVMHANQKALECDHVPRAKRRLSRLDDDSDDDLDAQYPNRDGPIPRRNLDHPANLISYPLLDHRCVLALTLKPARTARAATDEPRQGSARGTL